MQLNYQELWDTGRFRKVLEVRHDEILPFITGQLQPKSMAMKFFYGFHIVLLAFFLGGIYADVCSGNIAFFPSLGYFVAGILLFIIFLIPLHEGLHALVFFVIGAKHVRIIPRWKKLMVYAIADKFVINFGEFVFLALAPFIIINAVLVATLFAMPGPGKYALWSALLFHSTGCIGDFALLGFLCGNNPGKMLNYDDLQEETAFFFEELS